MLSCPSGRFHLVRSSIRKPERVPMLPSGLFEESWQGRLPSHHPRQGKEAFAHTCNSKLRCTRGARRYDVDPTIQALLPRQCPFRTASLSVRDGASRIYAVSRQPGGGVDSVPYPPPAGIPSHPSAPARCPAGSGNRNAERNARFRNGLVSALSFLIVLSLSMANRRFARQYRRHR